MDKPEVEFSRLTVKGQCTLPRRIRDYLGVGPGDQVAFVLTEQGVLVKKLAVRSETVGQQSPAGALRELVLAIGHEAQAQGLSEQEVEEDVDRYLTPRQQTRGK
jgi:AbrB family looped-hinge helix DNA binding protein